MSNNTTRGVLLPAHFDQASTGFSKVPEVTIGFWIIKILATTLARQGATRPRCR